MDRRYLSAAMAVATAVLAGCPRRTPPATGTDATTPTAADAASAPTATDAAAVVDVAPAAPPAVWRVRVRNGGTAVIRIRTNPDRNELVRAQRLTVSPTTSDRAAMFADGTRVSLFPIGRMPLCASDGGAGYGGLGLPGAVLLQPGETLDLGSWDGVQREEVLDPQRGVCQREFAPQPGRYRLGLDQGESGDYFPVCNRVLFAFPMPEGAPRELEIVCRAPVRDGGAPVLPPGVPRA